MIKVEFTSAKDGNPIFQTKETSGGIEKVRSLASSYNPLKEATRVLDDTSHDNPDMVFIFGGGNPSLIRLALEKYKNIPVGILENHSQIRSLLIQWFKDNYSTIFQKDQNRLLWGNDLNEDKFRRWFKDYSVKKILYLNNQKQIRLYPTFFLKAKDLITKIHNERSTNRSTIVKFEKLWLRNITKNTTQIIKSYPLLACNNQGKDLPAVIVGAGPSLMENLKALKEHQGQLIIIACDTVFKVLLHWKIQPDFVIAIDPQKINSRYIENVPNKAYKHTILICEPGIINQGIRHFPYIMMFDSIFPYYQLLAGFFKSKGEIDIGGTVISAAYELSKAFNFSPLAFTGMDFCFHEEIYHLQGTMYEEIFFSSLHRFQTFEMFFSKIIDNEIIPAQNHLGKSVFVDRKFILFKNWLEKKFLKDHQDNYNCSWGGLTLNGLPHLPFSEFLSKISSSNFNQESKQKFMSKLQEEISYFSNFRSLQSNNASDFNKVFTRFQEEYRKLINEIENYQAILKKTLRFIRNNKTEKVIALQDEIINSSTAKIAKPFVEIVIQKTLYQIREKNKEENMENILDELKPLYKLYKDLHEACSLNLKYLKRTRFEGKRIYTY